MVATVTARPSATLNARYRDLQRCRYRGWVAAAGDDGLVPSPRPLLTALGSNLRLPPDHVDVLVGLGQACNDAALAVLDAHAQLARSVEALWRLSDLVDDHSRPLAWVADEQYAACRDHAERLTAVYARVAVQYAASAVEVASRIADGHPPTVSATLPVVPSDLLRLAQVHVPLLQIPQHAPGGPQKRLCSINGDLSASHHRLRAVIAGVESPATAFDQPDHVAQTQTADLLEAEFPTALHDYATACAFAIALMTRNED